MKPYTIRTTWTPTGVDRIGDRLFIGWNTTAIQSLSFDLWVAGVPAAEIPNISAAYACDGNNWSGAIHGHSIACGVQHQDPDYLIRYWIVSFPVRDDVTAKHFIIDPIK